MVPRSAESLSPAWPSLPPLAHAFAAQLLAWLLTACVQILLGGATGWYWTAAHGVLAALVGRMFGLPWWWAPINAVFAPAVIAAQYAGLAAWWYLGAFIALAAVYWTTFRTRVPLYLSSAEACDRLATLLPVDREFKFLDVGCGVGTVLASLAPRFAAGKFIGLEIAPLPFVVSWLRGRWSQRFETRRVDFWEENLAAYDVVYAFLSPVPMGELWRKTKRDMRAGSVFVSNTFRVDGETPDSVIPLRGGRRSLYVWRL